MTDRKPFTEAESTIKKCLLVAAERLHGGRAAIRAVEKVPLSNDTMKNRSMLIGKDLKNQLLEKLRKSPCFGLQLDENADVAGEAQLLVYCRFPDANNKQVEEHMLFCDSVGIQTTGESIFSKLDDFFAEENLMWEKCAAVTTDGAAAMVGKFKGVIAFIKKKNKDCDFLHYMLHREALVAKKMRPKGSQEQNFLEKVFSEVVDDVVNEVRTRPKVSREFSSFCKEMLADYDTLILHSEIRFFSRGKVLQRFLSLKDEIVSFLNQRKCIRADLFKDLVWLGAVHYLSAIFNKLNQLNLSMQGKGADIFLFTSKVEGMKIKLELWKTNAKNGNFSNFAGLDEFLKNCGWEEKDPDLDHKLPKMVGDHLDLLSENFSLYFPKSLADTVHQQAWIVNPFVMENVKVSDLEENLQESLIDLSQDVIKKSKFQSSSYTEFWTSMLQEEDVKFLANTALKKLVMMPTTNLAEKGFSALVDIKNKKRNRLKSVDSLMRGALEELIRPRIENIAADFYSRAEASSSN